MDETKILFMLKLILKLKTELSLFISWSILFHKTICIGWWNILLASERERISGHSFSSCWERGSVSCIILPSNFFCWHWPREFLDCVSCNWFSNSTGQVLAPPLPGQSVNHAILQIMFLQNLAFLPAANAFSFLVCKFWIFWMPMRPCFKFQVSHWRSSSGKWPEKGPV